MQFGVNERSWIGALVGGFVGGVAIATAWQFDVQKHFLDIVTAVGTVGATGTALYLSAKDTRRRHGEAYDRASLAASSLTLRLATMFIDMKSLHTELAEASQADCNPGSFAAWHQRFSSVEWISTDEIASLIPLGHGCAPAIAGAQDRLHVGKRLIAQFASGVKIHLSDARKETAGHVAFIVGEAIELLDRAAKECQKAALRAIWP